MSESNSKETFDGKSVRILAASLCAVSLLGCNFIYDFDRMQCEVDRDCRERGDDFESTRCVEGYCAESCEEDDDCEDGFSCIESSCVDRWACLADQPDENSSVMLELKTTVSDIEGEPLADIDVNLCSNFDPTCDTPRAKLTTDDSGTLEFEVESDFAGYLETTAEGFFPQLNFLPEILSEDTELPALTLSPAVNIYGLAVAVDSAPDPERGHILLSLQSCTGPAPGVRISAKKSDAESVAFYVNGGFPTADLEATTVDSSGGFLNFQPGSATLDLLTEDGTEFQRLSVLVRANTISVLNFAPIGPESGEDNED